MHQSENPPHQYLHQRPSENLHDEPRSVAAPEQRPFGAGAPVRHGALVRLNGQCISTDQYYAPVLISTDSTDASVLIIFYCSLITL